MQTAVCIPVQTARYTSAREVRQLHYTPHAPRKFIFADIFYFFLDPFGPQQSLLNARYACMKLAKEPREDFVTYAGHMDCKVPTFFSTITEDQLRCLIFISGLQSSDDISAQLKLVDTVETNPTCSINTLTEECRLVFNLKHDVKMIEKCSLLEQTVNSV